jgi:hypothetical protein
MMSDYFPAIDTLLSLTIVSILIIGILSVPSPDSYLQDAHIDLLTVQARQCAVPLTVLAFPSLGVDYEVGLYTESVIDSKSKTHTREKFRESVIETSKATIVALFGDSNYSPFDYGGSTLADATTSPIDKYHFWVTFPKGDYVDREYEYPEVIDEIVGSYGIAWIEHPTTDPKKPLKYIVIKN